jgi:hypothetical protein
MASPQLTPQEAALAKAVQTWIAGLRAAVTSEDILHALASGSAQAILYALARAKQLVLDLLPAARDEGARTIATLDGAKRLELRFDIHDPKFLTAVEQRGAKSIVQIDGETRIAIQKLVSDGYRSGINPRRFAPAIAEIVGLTTRQALAVSNQHKANLEGGMPEAQAQRMAERYAARMRKLRAENIAITETMAAHSIARREAWMQAKRHGLLVGKTAYEEWLAVQTDPAEICFQMNGRLTPLGSDFDGLYPPAHVRCRCVTVLRLQ